MSALIVAGAVSSLKPLPILLRELVARTGGGLIVLHVEDAVADLLRKEPVDDVELEALVGPGARLLPERLWAPAADEAIRAALGDKQRQIRAVVLYRHAEYDPAALFPRLRMAALLAEVPVIDGRNGNLVRRDPNDRLREVQARLHPALRDAIEKSVQWKDRKAS